MKIPRSVIISGKKWKIVLKKELRNDGTETIMGLCDSGTRTIYLDSSLEKNDLALTFWHEFTHAVLSEAHISSNSSAGLAEIVEEVICESMAEAILGLKVKL